jgi:hypothetical protein
MSPKPATDPARNNPEALYDRAEIIDLVYRLGSCLDEGDFDEMRELLIEAATVQTPGGRAEGRDALIAQARRNHPADQAFQHVITNILVELDDDEASVRANLVVHVTPTGPPPADAPAPSPLASTGQVYRFQLVRTRDGWRFSHVETVPLWLTGTLPRTPAA